jgi:hypothetical protein
MIKHQKLDFNFFGGPTMFKSLFLILACFSVSAFAEAQYSLTCSMIGTRADVYVCNSGSSAEGNNEYVSVKACRGRDCDNDYDLMYIYATPGDCDLAGSIDFDDPKDFCIASFRN